MNVNTPISYPFQSPSLSQPSALQVQQGAVRAPSPSIASPNISWPTAPQVQPPGTSSTLNSLTNIITTLSQITNLAASLRTQNAAQGIGLVSGGKEFGNSVQQYYSLLTQPQAGSSPLESIGALGQSYLINNLKGDLAQAVSSQLGLNTSQLSLSQLGESAWSYLSGSQVAGKALAGVGNSAASKLGTSVTGGGSSEIFSGAGNILGAAGAAYGIYGLIKNWGKSSPVAGAIQGASAGAYIGSVVPGVGTLIGGVIGGVLGGIMGCFKCGKSKEQLVRDQVRAGLQKSGFLDQDYQFKLADGSQYDMGKDGGFKLPNSDGQTTRRAYEIDWQTPLAGEAVAMFGPISYMLSPDNEKVRNDFVGYLVNGALSNATTIEDARANARTILQSLKLDPTTLMNGVAALKQGGVIKDDVAKVFANTVATTYGAGA